MKTLRVYFVRYKNNEANFAYTIEADSSLGVYFMPYRDWEKALC